jgi:hypothetical protein
VFRFRNYEACQNAVAMLVWQFDRMQALAAFMRNPHWYWQNEEIIAQLKRLMAIDADEIRAHLNKHHAEVITYMGETYSRIYGSS